MKLFPKHIILILLIITSCSKKEEKQFDASKNFTSELTQLKEYFKIPGMAIAIVQNDAIIYENYLGFADIETKIKLNKKSSFPIASITKTFSGVLLMKLVEEGKLSLEDPINQYFEKPIFNDSVLVKHVVSHTSQGNVGEQFYYSSRFGALKRVIEQAAGKPFAEVLQEKILDPIALKNTFLLKDSTQLVQNKLQLVKPYIFDNEVKAGFVDFGYSTSAGIVSNLHDLLLFNKALDNNTLISEASKNKTFTPSKSNLPYGYGIFKQKFQNTDIVWTYGQYDCYSSLFLKVPSKDITLILLANNNLMSDPARLINGDVTSSLFALSFLKNYILKDASLALFEPKDSLAKKTTNSEFYRKKLLAEAMSESFMARYDSKKLQTSIQLLKKVFVDYPDYTSYANINLLHTLCFIKDVAFRKDLGEINTFDTHIEAIAAKLLKNDPQNPYANYYIGTYFDRKGTTEKTHFHYKAIVNAENFSKWWYTAEAKNWLEENSK